MKKKYSLSLLAFLCLILSGYGQIYTEDFTGQNGKGSVGPTPTTDVSGVTWSVDISSAALTASTDWFQVVNEFFEARDIDGNAIWLSPSIDISAFTDVFFNLDASEQGTMEASDIFNTEYRINGGGWLTAAINGNLNDDFTNATVSQTGLLGNTLEIRVTMNNGAGIEYHRLNDIIVDGTAAVASDLVISGTPTDHGTSCLTTAATTVTYTITNNSTTITALNVDVTSDDPQFAVSGLTSTTILPAGTADYDVTFTPTALGAQAATITVSSTTITDDATSALTGTGITSPTIDTQPTNQVTIVGGAAAFSITSPDATSYQWEVSTDGGTTWNTLAGETADTYTIAATTLAMDGNQYRCLATNVCGSTPSNAATLSVATIADVVITEIMYNSAGVDDEWIEICNVSGSTQVLNGYSINYNGGSFTFPATGVNVADGACITVSLGSDGDGDYNNGNGTIGNCQFTPDYGIDASTNDTNNLNNGGGMLSIIAPDGTTTIDTVTYDDDDGAGVDRMLGK